jgi:hypothetical protein
MKIYIILCISTAFIFYSCCADKNYSESISRYKEAKDLLIKHKKEITKYEGKSDNLLFASDKSKFASIVDQEKNDDLKKILDLWHDGLLSKEDTALVMYKNGDIIFFTTHCRKKEERVIYSPGEIEMFQTDETSFDIIETGWFLRVDR